jgi:hypothetical protein
MTSMPTSAEETLPAQCPTPTTLGCKRKADSIEPPTTDSSVKEDEKKYDIFSEESKLQLSTRISKCRCGGFRICLDIYKPTLVDSVTHSDSDSETDEKTPPETLTKTPRLCKRDCEDDSACMDDYSGMRVLPCTVCKRMTDDGDVDTDWDKTNCEEREDMICDEEICPGCLAKGCEDECSICNSYNVV